MWDVALRTEKAFGKHLQWSIGERFEMNLGLKAEKEENMNWVLSCLPVIPAFWTQGSILASATYQVQDRLG